MAPKPYHPCSVPGFVHTTAACRFGRACILLLRACGDGADEQGRHPIVQALASLLLSHGLTQLTRLDGEGGGGGPAPPLDVAAAALEAQLAVMTVPRSDEGRDQGDVLAAWLAAALAALRQLQAAAAAAPAAIRGASNGIGVRAACLRSAACNGCSSGAESGTPRALQSSWRARTCAICPPCAARFTATRPGSCTRRCWIRP